MSQRSIAPQRPRYFDLPNFYIESALIPKGRVVPKDERDAWLQFLLAMSFEPALPREPTRRVRLSELAGE